MKDNKKKIIVAIITVILALASLFFGIKYTDDDIEIISNSVETVANIIDTVEIPELKQEDEQTLEVQEADLENEAFERQGEVAYNGSDKVSAISVGEYKGLTYYSQADSRWAKHMYSSINDKSQTIIQSGCGPTSAAMIVSSIKGEITPDRMGDLFVKYGYRSANSGTYWSSMKWVADAFDIEYSETKSFDTMINKLQNNNYVVAICREGLFTYGGHFIVIVGVDGENLKIYDPYLYNGKFTTASRKAAKATVSGNTVTVSKANFKKYANAVNFFCYKNDREDTKVNSSTIKTTSSNTGVYKVNYKVKVTPKVGLNIRKGASTYYKKVGAYAKNTIVTITAESNGWGKTDRGWICLSYTTKVTSTNTTKYKVTARAGLNIRKGAGTSYKKVGCYKYNTVITVMKTSGNWGKTDKGWIYLKYTKKV